MELVNCVRTRIPVVDPKYADRFVFTANYPLNDNEAGVLGFSINAIIEQFEIENRKNIRKVILVFTKNGVFTFNLDDEALGWNFNLCVFPVGKWREKKLATNQLLVAFTEELVHHFWGIENEVLVKDKVFEIIKHKMPDIDIFFLYNVELLEENRKKINAT